MWGKQQPILTSVPVILELAVLHFIELLAKKKPLLLHASGSVYGANNCDSYDFEVVVFFIFWE